MSTNIKITDNYQWTNFHNNVHKQVLHRYLIFNDTSTGWKDGLKGIQEMIGQVRIRNERLRAYGGTWSLSDVGVCNDSILDSRSLLFFGTVGAGSIVGKPLFKDDPVPLSSRLFYFQSGCQINQINNELESRGLCLPTTGASNGQTIAGAISTGTHGSALKVGSMQDYIRALHIVTSETQHFIIQPKSNPVVSKSFCDIFGAKMINDDSLFYSALVSFGSYGIIHALIIESVSLFMLETYCLKADYSDVEKIFSSLKNFKHSSNNNLVKFLKGFNLPDDEDPFHVRLIVNPYETAQNAFIEVMYKRKLDKNKLSKEPESSDRVGNDVLSFIAIVTNSIGEATPILMNNFVFDKVLNLQAGYTQTPRNIFGDTTHSKPDKGGASIELGIPIKNAADAERIISTTILQMNFMGIMGIRFVKNSKATLAFTRFSPLTCTIELVGFESERTRNFYKQVFLELDNAKIPFTLHWGQQGDFSKKRLAVTYGDALVEWINNRNRLLPDPIQRYMFTNDFLKQAGLSESPNLTGGGEIV